MLRKQLPPQRDWIAPGIVPRSGLVIIGADSKAGKSMFGLEMIRALTVGETPFDYPGFTVPETTRVLYVEAEIGEYGLQDRGRKIFSGTDTDLLNQNLYYVSKLPELQLHTQQGVKLLDSLIEQVQPGVLFLDPIGRLHGFDENDNSEIGRLFYSLDYLVRKYKHNEMAVVLIHHMRKKGGYTEHERDPLSFHHYRGSSRFAADPDTLVTLNRQSDIKSASGRKAWTVSCRWETRQGESPEDMLLTVNAKDDLRVRYDGQWKGKVPEKLDDAGRPKKEPKTPRVTVSPPTQLSFPEAEKKASFLGN